MDRLFHPFSDWLSSHHGVEVDRENGTPVAPGVIRDAFEAFAPDEEQRALFSEVFDVAEKLGCDYRIDHSRPNSRELAYEIGGHITLHADKLDARHGKEVAETILHEMIHGVTAYAIGISQNEAGVEGVSMPKSLHEAVAGLRAVYGQNQDLLEDYEKKDGHGIYEFVADLSNPDFRKKLERRGALRRVIDAIVDMFKSLFGIPRTTRANAQYERAVAALRDILANYDKTAFEANRAAAEASHTNPNFSIRDEGVNFSDPALDPERTGVPPTPEEDRKLYGFTNGEVADAMKAAGMEPPKPFGGSFALCKMV